jgi:CMP-N,N'-diacetyllegionaminic acid synthase
MEPLIVIPARKGSKGLPGKNTRMLGSKPLIQYSIETALSISSAEHICVTTDSEEVQQIALNFGLSIPFTRPEHLATDTSGTREVILHALEYYASIGRHYETVILLQPTSPFRKKQDIEAMIRLYDQDTEMVVSVKESHDNPYFSMFEESSNGYLQLVKPGKFSRRQDCPKVYSFNGSVYVINVASYQKMLPSSFTKIKKYVMDELYSVDIDQSYDWYVAEMILEKQLISF